MNRHQVRQPRRSQAFWITGKVASRYATWGARRGVEYCPFAGRGRLPGRPPGARLLPQDRAQARGSPGQRERAVQAGRAQPARRRGRGAAHRGGQGRRGPHRVRDLGGPGGQERRGGAGPDPRPDRRADHRDDRERGGAAHLPGRPAVVRLVLGAAAGHRHRRRVARGSLRPGRGAGRGDLAPARRRPSDQGLDPRRPAVRAGRPAPAQARASADRPGNRRRAAARPARSRGRDLEDLPPAGPDRGRGPVGRRPVRQARPAARRPRRPGRTPAQDVRGRAGQAARRLGQPGGPAPGGRHRGRRRPGPDGCRPARALPLGATRRRHPPAPGHARPGPGG
jgi:hypothetical protein